MERFTANRSGKCANAHSKLCEKYEHCDLCPHLQNAMRLLAYYEEMEEQDRLVVLEEPRLPLIWGDDAHNAILCPNCERDLMGGFELASSDSNVMIQCPHCGQLIDGTKAFTREETEQALKKGVGHG